MEKIIKVSEAQLSTVQVEVKTLAIKGKQLTLSVFRQIPEFDLFEADNWCGPFKQRGAVWGTVNYFWKESPEFEMDFDDRPVRCIHVVWQKGVELRRYRMPWRILYRPDKPPRYNPPYQDDMKAIYEKKHQDRIARHQEEINEYNQAVTTWKGLYEQVEKTGQLFIAV